MGRRVSAYWLLSEGRGAIQTQELTDPGPGELLLKTLASGVSPGTERLVGLGQVPYEAQDAMRCAYMEGRFTFPLKYGYSLVGIDSNGQRFFAMHPHQSAVVVSRKSAIPLPDEIPTARAVLYPAMETAQNAIWDAELEPTDISLVVGGGLIGVLIALILHGLNGMPTAVVEVDPARRAFLNEIPWIRPLAPDSDLPAAPSCVFHCSASAQGLQWGIDNSVFEAKIVELSWYGDNPVTLQLGANFHYQRKRIISSQVSSIARAVREQFDRAERTRVTLDKLRFTELDCLLYPVQGLAALPALMTSIYQCRSQALAPVVLYDQKGEGP
jgi:hypothetical protein